METAAKRLTDGTQCSWIALGSTPSSRNDARMIAAATAPNAKSVANVPARCSHRPGGSALFPTAGNGFGLRDQRRRDALSPVWMRCGFTLVPPYVASPQHRRKLRAPPSRDGRVLRDHGELDGQHEPCAAQRAGAKGRPGDRQRSAWSMGDNHL